MISSMVREQPTHRPVASSMRQILTQGESEAGESESVASGVGGREAEDSSSLGPWFFPLSPESNQLPSAAGVIDRQE